MDDTSKMFCLSCGNKVHEDLECIDITNMNDEKEVILTLIAYVCDKCGHINLYKDAFCTYKQEN